MGLARSRGQEDHDPETYFQTFYRNHHPGNPIISVVVLLHLSSGVGKAVPRPVVSPSGGRGQDKQGCLRPLAVNKRQRCSSGR